MGMAERPVFVFLRFGFRTVVVAVVVVVDVVVVFISGVTVLDVMIRYIHGLVGIANGNGSGLSASFFLVGVGDDARVAITAIVFPVPVMKVKIVSKRVLAFTFSVIISGVMIIVLVCLKVNIILFNFMRGIVMMIARAIKVVSVGMMILLLSILIGCVVIPMGVKRTI